MKLVFNSLPQTKARPRKGKHGFYDPKSHIQREIRNEAAAQIWNKGVLKPLKAPISVGVRLYVPMPHKWSKKRKKEHLGKPVTKRPDIDNYLKFYFDALTGVLYEDDSQVSQGFFEKLYSEEGRVEIITSPHEESLDGKITKLASTSIYFYEIIEQLAEDFASIYLSSECPQKIKKIASNAISRCRGVIFENWNLEDTEG